MSAPYAHPPAGQQRRRLLLAAASALVSACGGGGDGGSPSAPPTSATAPSATPTSASSPSAAPVSTKSAKRGIAYDLSSAADFAALAPAVAWWYNWSGAPKGDTASALRTRYAMDFMPMLWNENFNDAAITTMLQANPQMGYLLALNEPNLTGQATRTPQQAADLWPRIEQIAANTGVKIVGPQMTWGNTGYNDPIAWLDAFYQAYRTANGNRDPKIDYLGFHWYDYGLKAQLDRLAKYNKPFWITEMANWHVGDGSAAIDSFAKQKAQMTEMVALCESRADVFRYAWFTGRGGADLNDKFTSLLGLDGQLTELGQHYLSLPVVA